MKSWKCLFIVISLLLSATSASLMADTFTERRIGVGMKLFRTMLVADTSYQRKLKGDDKLRVYVLHHSSPSTVKYITDSLKEDLTDLHDIPVVVETLSVKDYLSSPPDALGLFIGERMPAEQLQQLINASIQQQFVLFSPFEGDVEKGVMAGLAVESKVQPYIHLKSLQQSQIKIRPFFLKVSKIYAP